MNVFDTDYIKNICCFFSKFKSIFEDKSLALAPMLQQRYS
jgi:hypothetical protein